MLNTYNPLQQIKFADGTTWGLTDILGKLFAGTANAETIGGTLNADTINGLAGLDYLYGRAGNDLLDGGAGVDYLYGGDGDDVLLGGTGVDNDLLYGENGNDTLDGGDGKDSLTGGAGIDHFRFSTTLGVNNIDTLTDFVAGTDKIDLSKAIFTAFGGAAVGSSLNNAEIGNHLLYTASSGALAYDADGSAGSGAAVQIAIVGSGTHPASLPGWTSILWPDEFGIIMSVRRIQLLSHR